MGYLASHFLLHQSHQLSSPLSAAVFLVSSPKFITNPNVVQPEKGRRADLGLLSAEGLELGAGFEEEQTHRDMRFGFVPLEDGKGRGVRQEWSFEVRGDERTHGVFGIGSAINFKGPSSATAGELSESGRKETQQFYITLIKSKPRVWEEGLARLLQRCLLDALVPLQIRVKQDQYPVFFALGIGQSLHSSNGLLS
nr:protein PHYLLO, chloroplastic isoform X2 [Ipomoea batatas]